MVKNNTSNLKVFRNIKHKFRKNALLCSVTICNFISSEYLFSISPEKAGKQESTNQFFLYSCKRTQYYRTNAIPGNGLKRSISKQPEIGPINCFKLRYSF